MVKISEMLEKVEERIGKETEIARDQRISFFEAITPAFVGGIITGLIVGIPGLSLLVPAIPIGGYVAVKLVRDYYGKYISERDAAKVGAAAGLIGAFFGTLITLIVASFFAEPTFQFFRSAMDPRAAELILTLGGLDPYVSFLTLRLRFVVNVVLCTILCAGGGVFYIKRLTSK